MDFKLILGVMTLLVVPFTTGSSVTFTGTQCDLVKFHGGNFQNSGIVDGGFKRAIQRLNDYAEVCKVKIYITSSFRKDDKKILWGTIVKPSKISNHFVGHAIDMNLMTPFIDGSRHFCNSQCMGDEKKQTEGEKCFLFQIGHDTALRWGGNFSTPDPVHIDDGINKRNRAEYNRLFASLQTSCKTV